MGITFDSAQFSGSGGPGTAGPTGSFAHACDASLDYRWLWVSVYTTLSDRTTAVTYNGVSLTKIGTVVNNGTWWVTLWYLPAPDTGVHTISMTFSPNAIWQAYSASYGGVNTVQTPIVSSSSSFQATVVSTHDNSWALITNVQDFTFPSAGAGTTARAGGGGPYGQFLGDSNGPKVVAGSITLAVSTFGSTNFASLIVAFAPKVIGAGADTLDLSAVAYTSSAVAISVGGTIYSATDGTTSNILLTSLRITLNINDTPDTCGFTARGFVPVIGQRVIVAYQDVYNPNRLFTGTILTCRQTYFSTKTNPAYEVNCVDDTWLINFRKVNALYTGMSIYAIALDLAANYAPGFTTNGIDPTLLSTTDITFSNTSFMSAMTQLAKRANATCDISPFQDIKLSVSETTNNPTGVDADHPTLRNFDATYDLGQIVNRVISRGGGGRVLTDIPVGGTTIPVSDTTQFPDTGGIAEVDQMRLTFTGIAGGSGGALVGPGVQPSVGPTVVPATGTGLGQGTYTYAVVYLTTGTNRTLPSPLTTAITTNAFTLTNPSVAPAALQQVDSPGHFGTTGSYPNFNAGAEPPSIGDVVEYAYSYSTATDWNDLTQESALSPSSGTITVEQSLYWYTSYGYTVAKMVSLYPSGYTGLPAGATWMHIWRKRNGGSWQAMKQGANLLHYPPNTAPFLQDGSYADSGITPPSPNAVVAAMRRVNITSVPIGPSGTTKREIYRTVVNGSQLKLQQTINDNTTTTGVQDVTADGSLGANAPSSDTSGLSTTTGQVLPGADSILTSGAGDFSSTGGWALVSSRAILYTGITGATLTGVPASGSGSIETAINYGTQIIPAPTLTGIPPSGDGSVINAITSGDGIFILAIEEDLAAQSYLSTVLDPNSLYSGAWGIREDYIAQDGISVTEATARARAQLALLGYPQLHVTYDCRDTLTAPGKSVQIYNPAGTTIFVTVKIQTVIIDTFNPNRNVFPTYHVQASSIKFNYDDLMSLITNHEAIRS